MGGDYYIVTELVVYFKIVNCLVNISRFVENVGIMGFGLKNG